METWKCKDYFRKEIETVESKGEKVSNNKDQLHYIPVWKWHSEIHCCMHKYDTLIKNTTKWGKANDNVNCPKFKILWLIIHVCHAFHSLTRDHMIWFMGLNLWGQLYKLTCYPKYWVLFSLWLSLQSKKLRLGCLQFRCL